MRADAHTCTHTLAASYTSLAVIHFYILFYICTFTHTYIPSHSHLLSHIPTVACFHTYPHLHALTHRQLSRASIHTPSSLSPALTHPHSCCHTYTYALTRVSTYTPSLPPTLTHTHTHALNTYTCTHTCEHTPIHLLSCTPTLMLSHKHSHVQAHTPPSDTLTCSLTSPCSRSHICTHMCEHAHTPSLSPALTLTLSCSHTDAALTPASARTPQTLSPALTHMHTFMLSHRCSTHLCSAHTPHSHLLSHTHTLLTQMQHSPMQARTCPSDTLTCSHAHARSHALAQSSCGRRE